jgi:phage-related protein
MAEKTIYEELRDILKDFKEFLDDKVAIIKPAINALAAIVPQIIELIDKLVSLVNQLKTEINNLNVGAIPALGEVSTFTQKIKAFLEVSKKLLPEQTGTIDEVLAVADVVTGLPTLDQVKAEIITLIDAIIGHLNSLKA